MGVVSGQGHGKQGIPLAGSPYSPGRHSTSGTQRPSQGPSETRL